MPPRGTPGLAATKIPTRSNRDTTEPSRLPRSLTRGVKAVVLPAPHPLLALVDAGDDGPSRRDGRRGDYGTRWRFMVDACRVTWTAYQSAINVLYGVLTTTMRRTRCHQTAERRPPTCSTRRGLAHTAPWQRVPVEPAVLDERELPLLASMGVHHEDAPLVVRKRGEQTAEQEPTGRRARRSPVPRHRPRT